MTLEYWFQQNGLTLIIGLLGLTIFFYFMKKYVPAYLTQRTQGNVSNLQSSHVAHEEPQYTKEEKFFLEKVVNNPLLEFNGKLHVFGKTITVKPKKTEFPVFEEQVNPEQLEAVKKDHKQKMKNLLEKAKPPHKNNHSEIDEKPEAPTGGWEEYLEEGVPEVGTKKK